MDQLITDSDYQLLKDLMNCQTESGKIVPDKFIPYTKYDRFVAFDERKISSERSVWNDERIK